MASETNFAFSSVTPVAPAGKVLALPQSSPGDPTQISFAVPAQVNADWNATSGLAQVLNKPAITSGGGPATTHAEPLTDGGSNFIFGAGDIIVAVGVPN
jgi:hypothetical protein